MLSVPASFHDLGDQIPTSNARMSTWIRQHAHRALVADLGLRRVDHSGGHQDVQAANPAGGSVPDAQGEAMAVGTPRHAPTAVVTSRGSGRTLRRETSTMSPARSRSCSVSTAPATTCHGCPRPGRTTVAPAQAGDPPPRRRAGPPARWPRQLGRPARRRPPGQRPPAPPPSAAP